MALILAKSFNSRLVLDSLRTLSLSNIKQCHWYPDFKPGPYPRTEAERNAAAKKYNLLPEEYQPMPDDDNALGDYPDLSHYKRYEDRDPYHYWDFPDMRRDFLEPVPIHAITLLPEFANTASYGFTPKRIFTHLIKSVTILVTFAYVIKNYVKLNIPALETQVGREGVTHYTFELDYDQQKK